MNKNATVGRRLTRNRAQCLYCFDIVESAHRHDWQQCKCGALYVDGGLEYIRRGAANFDMVNELCEYSEELIDARNDATGITDAY